MSRQIDLIREGYECVHEEDGDKLLELFDDEIEMTDPLTRTVVRGKEAMARLWQRSLGAVHSIVPGEFVETGDVVLVVAHHDFYDRELTRLGEGVSEIHRFTFRGDRIAKLEVTTFDEIPEDVRERIAASGRS
ncbi:MAG: nuclear transport factor 2 family protein [Acidimicrobiales bacterium]|jgi:ketosteroid isomerase-like protein